MTTEFAARRSRLMDPRFSVYPSRIGDENPPLAILRAYIRPMVEQSTGH